MKKIPPYLPGKNGPGLVGVEYVRRQYKKYMEAKRGEARHNERQHIIQRRADYASKSLLVKAFNWSTVTGPYAEGKSEEQIKDARIRRGIGVTTIALTATILISAALFPEATGLSFNAPATMTHVAHITSTHSAQVADVVNTHVAAGQTAVHATNVAGVVNTIIANATEVAEVTSTSMPMVTPTPTFTPPPDTVHPPSFVEWGEIGLVGTLASILVVGNLVAAARNLKNPSE